MGFTRARTQFHLGWGAMSIALPPCPSTTLMPLGLGSQAWHLQIPIWVWVRVSLPGPCGLHGCLPLWPHPLPAALPHLGMLTAQISRLESVATVTVLLPLTKLPRMGMILYQGRKLSSCVVLGARYSLGPVMGCLDMLAAKLVL
uniref:Uncharacterized protein n=1 Tax=Opuntia streptacantha TaxID=393608 RepID=A0A7C9DFB8_OPUST